MSVSGIFEVRACEFGDNPRDRDGYRRWDDMIQRERGSDVERRHRKRTRGFPVRSSHDPTGGVATDRRHQVSG